MRHTKSLACIFAAVAALSGCGGGGGDKVAAPPTPPTTPTAVAPGGLYVGYYQEDPTTNPEDPTPGAFTLNLPSGDANFSGSMFFTYVGCQVSNVGAITGTKLSTALSGNWAGSIDNLPQSGAYTGTYNASVGSYAGTYTNSRGKQFRDLSPCISYWIGPNGTWEMFPVGTQVPSTFNVTLSARTVAWGATTGAAYNLVYLLDVAVAQSSGNPVLWQTLISGTSTSATIPSTVALQTGKTYLVAVGVSNGSSARVAFGSRQFTP